MRKINTTIFFLMVCCIQYLDAQTVFNPFTQNIHFAPEPIASGFLCGSKQTVIFSQGLTTTDDAVLWQTNPLTVTICISGFEFDSSATSLVTGSYASNFTWSSMPGSSTCLVGTQNQTLYGTGTNPLFPNPLASGEIALALKVPANLATGTVLSVNVTLQVPSYMSAFNSSPDDDESTQTQSNCGCDPITSAGNIGSNQTYCKNADPFPFTSLSAASGGSGASIQYQWQVNDGAGWIDILGATNLTYDADFMLETHQYRRNAKRLDCVNWMSSNVVIVTIHPLPFVDASADQSMAPGMSTQIGTPAISGNTYSWLPTASLNASNIAQPIATPTTTTTYTLTVTNSFGCVEIDSVTIHINVTPPPPPHIVAYPNAYFCFGQHIVLTAYGEPGAVFQWSMPSGCNAAIDNSHSGISMLDILNLDASCNGQFIVTQQVAGYPISQSDTMIVDGSEKPIIQFVTTSCVSNNGEVNVNATGTSTLEYSINGGNYQSSNVLTTAPGAAFVVAVKNTNASCIAYYEGSCVYCASSSSCTTPPSDSIIAPKIACANSPIHLDGYFSNASNAVWSSSGTGIFTTTSSSVSPSHTIYTPSLSDLEKGHVVITFTTNDPDGSGPCKPAVCSKNILIIDRVVYPIVNSNSPLCANETLTLQATGAIGDIGWDGPNWFSEQGNSISIPNIDTTMNGVFIANASVAGCMNAPNDNLTYFNVVVHSLPQLNVAAYGYPESCFGNGNGTIHVNTSGGSGNYSVCYGGIFSNCDSGSSMIFHWLSPGMYTVHVVDAQCPNSTFNYPVQVTAGPIIPAPVINSSLSVCQGDPLVLSGTVSYPAITMNWIHTASFLNVIGNPFIFPHANMVDSGIYYVKALDVNGCASAQVQVDVNVYARPTISHVETICNGTTANIEITASAGSSFLYSLDGIQYQTSNVFTNIIGGNYTLHVKNSLGNCETELPISVMNCACPTAPIVNIVAPSYTCGSSIIPLLGSFTNIATATWTTTGSGILSSSVASSSPTSINYVPSNSDLNLGYVYLMLTTADPDGVGPCTPVSQTVLIHIVDSLQTPLIVTSKPIYCEGDTVKLYANQVNSDVYWSGVGGYSFDSSVALILHASSSASGVYTASVSGNGCLSKSASINVNVLPAPTLNIITTVIPEACEGQGNGAIHVEVNGGSGNYQICNATNPTCFITTDEADFKWLPPTTYQIKVSDLSCPNAWTNISETIDSGLHVDPPTSVSVPPICDGEAWTMSVVTPSTGNFLWTGLSNGFTANGQTVSINQATTSMSGSYKVQQIENGCASQPYYFDMTISDIPTINHIDTFCTGGEEGGRIVVNAIINGSGAIEYALNNGAYQASPIFDQLKNGLYSIHTRTVGSQCESIIQTTNLYCECHCGKEASISIFPNPSIGNFTITGVLDGPSDDIQISVINLTGQIIWSKKLNGEQVMFSEPIDIRHYAAGSYLVKVNIDGESYIKPITITE